MATLQWLEEVRFLLSRAHCLSGEGIGSYNVRGGVYKETHMASVALSSPDVGNKPKSLPFSVER